jgi:nitrite reductase/ring-hydroxylating ferredoxin subunit
MEAGATGTAGRVVLGPVSDFPEGTTRRVEVEGRAIAIFNVDGSFYALRDVCPHQGAPLSKGPVIGSVSATAPGCYVYRPEEKRVRCPWHGWEYDLRTGRSSFDPKRSRVRAFAVSVEHGSALAADATPDEQGRLPGPYVAETFAISIEDDYVVIDLGKR